MPKTQPGILLECDSTVKQIVLMLNERRKQERPGYPGFVLEDLDDTHLFLVGSDDVLRDVRSTINAQLDESRKPRSMNNPVAARFRGRGRGRG
ncbi:hypothetical protein AMAG_12111 [Allomyces macrogynus ATCC 38327]|uniref:General transcription and DNA repair factor IIH subunit TFB5 n=1 Tax=Allomyces macrogynus (strain ATCC 38327) TaxID=578462 RepID=A0A0L0SXH6_ALLM3|nr:hypothetical protein AMAG_12111 [Allomyces macrogynus ATCC 38327]|eukprot:KNE67034.1 hypothetical protein AMAG_12111 [Allomyces macrogynus ATCC 38327]